MGVPVCLILAFLSLSAQTLEEEVLQIKYFRYQSLYRSRVDNTVPLDQRRLLSDLNLSLKEAFWEKDYISAEVLLDEALALVLSLPETMGGPDSLAPATAEKPSVEWESAVLGGMEYSQYDSVSDWRSFPAWSPYTQVETELKFPLLGLPTVLSGYVKYNHEKSITFNQYTETGHTGRKWGFQVRNDLLFSHEQDTSLTDYLENNAETELRYNVGPRLSLINRNTVNLRQYTAEDSSSNYNYAINYNKTYMRFGDPEGLNLDGGFEHEYRFSTLDRDNNYQEFTGLLLVDKYFGWTNRVSVGSEHNYRRYTHPNDTSYFINDYLETLIYAEGVLTFLTRYRAKLAIAQEFRIYQLNSLYSPDTHVGRIVPGLALDLFGFLTLGCNLHYEQGYFSHPDSSDSIAQDYANGEDYHALALELTLDIFLTGHLFLNLSDKFELREYRNPEKSMLNQDARTNSFVIFLTWTILPWLELSVTTFDDLENTEKKTIETIKVPASESVLKNYSAELVFKF
jgi:hypothetical protein